MANKEPRINNSVRLPVINWSAYKSIIIQEVVFETFAERDIFSSGKEGENGSYAKVSICW